MPLFVCAKCHCIENTACGWWWSRDDHDILIWDESNEEFKGKGLCSECAPCKYNDGTPTKFGKWHGKFPKQYYPETTYIGLLFN